MVENMGRDSLTFPERPWKSDAATRHEEYSVKSSKSTQFVYLGFMKLLELNEKNIPD